MIRAVFDTNIIISGRLWSGSPRAALLAAYQGQIQLVISEAMIDELKDVISRPKFSKRLQTINQTADDIVTDHLRFTEVIEAVSLPPTVLADLDDDHVLACAVSGKTVYIVTGDPHLLRLKQYESIPIVTSNDLLNYLNKDS